MYQRCFAPWVAVAIAMVAAALHTAAADAQTRPGSAALRMESAGWHGRAIERPRPAELPSTAVSWPAGWSAGGVGYGVGYVRDGGSHRVRAVQRTLRGLGYRPGPVDGRFGARTAAAVGWFQYKHALPSTGSVGARTLTALRSRSRGEKLPRPTGEAQPAPARSTPIPAQPGPPSEAPKPDEPARAAEPSVAPTLGEPTPAAEPAGAAERPAADPEAGTTDITPVILGTALLLWLAGMAVYLIRSRRHGEPAGALVPEPAPSPVCTGVLGYVTLGRDELAHGISHSVLALLDAESGRRGLELVRIVHDIEPASGRASDRPGLFHALEEVGAGRAAGLLVPRLRDLTDSAPDIAPLMRWFDDADARLVVVDVGLDTHAEAGRIAVEALAEVSEWERRRIAERTRSGLAAMRAGRASGREAVADDPELTARIRQMRADGMSLQAIADVLNAEGIPTRRGGSRWRPSSVQTAAGYKRPPARRHAVDLPPPNGRRQ